MNIDLINLFFRGAVLCGVFLFVYGVLDSITKTLDNELIKLYIPLISAFFATVVTGSFMALYSLNKKETPQQTFQKVEGKQ